MITVVGNLLGCTSMTGTETPVLSHVAWLVLDQLRGGRVWDGDIICKSGRDELIKSGLASRSEGGVTSLTWRGREIAISM